MVSSRADLDSTFESVYKTMLSARQLKNGAVLSNLIIYKPGTHNATLRSGKVQMLKRFFKMRKELFEVRDTADAI